MSRYGDIIKQGRSSKPEGQERSDVGKEVNTDSGKEVNTDSGKEVNAEIDKEVKDDERPVNITIKVPRKSRQYWTSQCKLQGVTMTEVLVEALIERFGEPQ